jgi:hypothetical protein
MVFHALSELANGRPAAFAQSNTQPFDKLLWRLGAEAGLTLEELAHAVRFWLGG